MKLYVIEEYANSIISGYDHKAYWMMKFKMYDSKLPRSIRYWHLLRIKRMETRNSASLGIRMDGGSHFDSPPILPHGIKGIFVASEAKLGSNVTIFQQVTIGIIGYGSKAAPQIGNNVLIGAGAKIIGNISIGDNVRIGANCVVTKDVPSNCTAVGNPARIIRHVDVLESK